ncbi:MAG: hypothetical protein AAF845_15460 [Bacteroidota bacterium]
MKRLSLLFLAAVAFAGCDSNEPDDRAGLTLYVGNQGNFADNNGSLTRYVVETGETTPDAVPNLGGLVQNLYGADDELYVLLNFSDSFTTGRGRIDVVDATTRARTQQIDVRTPRALSVKTSTGAEVTEFYATNLYAGTATPVNVVTGTAGTPVAVGANPEGAVDVGSRTYVANSGFGSGTTLSVLNTDTGATVETLGDVCTGPRTLLRDNQDEVWVICTGRTDFATQEVTGGAVVVLDGADGDEIARFDYDETIGSASFGRDGVFVPGDDEQEVYVVAQGAILRFDANTNTASGRIEVAGAPIGAVEVDPEAGRIYLGRPNAESPFGADGEVTIHDLSGAEVGRFGAGVAPSVFAFVREGTPEA